MMRWKMSLKITAAMLAMFGAAATFAALFQPGGFSMDVPIMLMGLIVLVGFPIALLLDNSDKL